MEGLFAMVIDDYDRRHQLDIYIVRKRVNAHLLLAVGKVNASEFGTDHNRAVHPRSPI